MNHRKVSQLLDQWDELIDTSKKISLKKANSSMDIEGRIKRTTGKPVVFDSDMHDNQKNLQRLLCEEWPKMSRIINSQPMIMDGYAWIRKDYIDLYFEHYSLVIFKLRQSINKEEKGENRI
jgi:hypothetical protein